ncbi:MAG TPA: hypothetical protein VJV96_12805, partial [Candidatus Angelobacter sp.]|nr:hypothetical protein [Candidatus Angelobacter sp.]
MVRARRIVFCLVVLVGSSLFLSAQQAIVSPAMIDSNSRQSNSARLISFSDTLPGQPDGALTVTFALYPDQQGSAALWMETQIVQITNGKYTALLGSTDPNGIPAGLFAADQPQWLAVQANGVETRHLLVSVPYALKAVETERFGGLLPSQYVTTAQLQAILQNQAASGIAPAPGTQTTSPIQTAAATGTTPQPATDFTDNNTSEVLLVTQQGTGYAIHAISAGDAALLAENSSTTGTALKAFSSAASGTTTGILVQVASIEGIAGVFDNTAGGAILSLRNTGNVVTTVKGNGDITTTGQVFASTFNGSGAGLLNIPLTAINATPITIPNSVVARDTVGSFQANQITATLFSGDGSGLFNIPLPAINATPITIPNSVVARDTSGSFQANQITANVFSGSGAGLFNIPLPAINATAITIPNSVVARDSDGSFQANQITANAFSGSGAGLFNIPL